MGEGRFHDPGSIHFFPFYIKNSTSERLNSKAELSVFPATSQPSKAVPEPVYLLLLWLLVNVDSLGTCVWGQANSSPLLPRLPIHWLLGYLCFGDKSSLLSSFLGSPSISLSISPALAFWSQTETWLLSHHLHLRLAASMWADRG